jgi:hypothetical protein
MANRPTLAVMVPAVNAKVAESMKNHAVSGCKAANRQTR